MEFQAKANWPGRSRLQNKNFVFYCSRKNRMFYMYALSGPGQYISAR